MNNGIGRFQNRDVGNSLNNVFFEEMANEAGVMEIVIAYCSF
jgi:hypothetical protein